MKIIILGAGINGVLSAYFLARAGCKVEVIDRAPQSASGCSGGNGGQLSFGHCQPWSARSSFFAFAKSAFWSAFRRNSFFSAPDVKNPEFWRFAWQFWQNSAPQSSQNLAMQTLKLGIFSHQVLADILNEENIEFSYKKDGILHFYRDEKLFNQAIFETKKQKSWGLNLEVLNAQQCVQKEPTLVKMHDDGSLKGGVFFKDDASGNCSSFIKALEWLCKNKLGVKFHYNAEVKNLLTNHKKITGVNSSAGVFVGNAYLNCLGAFGNALLQGVGVQTKIYPLKGYSLSIPADKLFLAPQLSLTDPENKIVYSRLGSFFRAAGTVEAASLNKNLNPKNINFLKNTVKSSFSDFGDLNNAKEWLGFRPFRPNSQPLVQAVPKYGNLFLNCGHGSLGWTLSFATSRIISNIILQQKVPADFNFLNDSQI
jgi:D-amino-acid dehydrogenase